MAATKRRLRKSVDAVLFSDNCDSGWGRYWMYLPRGLTTLEELWAAFDENGDTVNCSVVDLCTADFEKAFGNQGLRRGDCAKVRITIERI